MTDAPPKDQQQFEQVLDRLDALIKRSHSGVAELPPALETTALELILPVEEELPSAQESGSLPTFVVVESTPIPILTDVYEGEKASPPPASAPAPDHPANLAPAILAALDRAIHEELAQLQQSLAIRLRREITAALQQPEEAAEENLSPPDSPAAGD